MEDTKKDEKKDTHSDTSSQGEKRPLQFEDTQADLLGTSVASVGAGGSTESMSEKKEETKQEEKKTEPVSSAGAPMGAAPEDGEEPTSKKQIVSFVAGLIIGALLTSIFI